jgi:hypothetical protein
VDNTEATSIDGGTIAGVYYDDVGAHGFTAVIVPEPSTWALLAGIGVMLGAGGVKVVQVRSRRV